MDGRKKSKFCDSMRLISEMSGVVKVGCHSGAFMSGTRETFTLLSSSEETYFTLSALEPVKVRYNSVNRSMSFVEKKEGEKRRHPIFPVNYKKYKISYLTRT